MILFNFIDHVHAGMLKTESRGTEWDMVSINCNVAKTIDDAKQFAENEYRNDHGNVEIHWGPKNKVHDSYIAYHGDQPIIWLESIPLEKAMI